MDHIVIWGSDLVSYFFLKIEKKLKGGGGEGEEHLGLDWELVRMTYGIRYLQNEPEEVRVSCKTLVRTTSSRVEPCQTAECCCMRNVKMCAIFVVVVLLWPY